MKPALKKRIELLEKNVNSGDSMNIERHRSFIQLCRNCGDKGTDEEILKATPCRSFLEVVDALGCEERGEANATIN
jgi:hypothetical protein